MPFDPVRCSLSDPDGENNSKQVEWEVEVRSDGDLITREVWCDGKPWDQCGHEWEPQPVVWPTWSARSQGEGAASGSPLAGVQDYWSTAGNRLRDSAKWTAAVLGLAVATVIGTSPLAGMREQRPPPIAVFLGSSGLVVLGITMFLVLQVMRPQSVSYTDVQYAAPRWSWLPQRPLYKWRRAVESQRDLYLPCGVRCLTGLRQSMIIEEITLMALSRAKATARDQASRDKVCEAQAARAGTLSELRVTADRIAMIGEYYKLRYRSSWATYGGVLCGLCGTAAVVAAFAWPLH
jgi:hypothetical protein